MRSTLIYSIVLLMLALPGIFIPSAKAIEVSDLHFKELNRRHGLSDNSVLDIVEDDKGYIWLATTAGLNRYSGDSIKKYYPSDSDESSIPPGFIQDLFIDSSGQLWIGTHEGLAKYLPKTDNFLVFNSENSVIKTNHITAISESVEGDILFTDRKFLYKIIKGTSQIRIVSQVFENETLIKVIFDEPNRTWVGSKNLGARFIDKEDNKIFDISKVNPFGISLDLIALHDIKVIAGNYWLATDNGVKILGANGKLLKSVDNSSLGSSGNINTLSIELINENLWMSTTSSLFILQGVTKKSFLRNETVNFLHLNSDTYDSTGLPSAIILKVIEDRTGSVWAATFKQGAFRYHPDYASVYFKPTYNSDRMSIDNHTAVWAFAEAENKDIFLVSQTRGLGKIRDGLKDVDFYDLGNYFDYPISFWDLKIDPNQLFWLASSDGLLVYDFVNGKPELKIHLFEGKFIDRIHIDEQKIWVWVDSEGTVSIDFNSLNDGGFIEIATLSDGLLEERLIPIFTDSKRRLWLRNNHKLVIYSSDHSQIFKTIELSEGIFSTVYGVYETTDFYWLTTRSNGIISLEKNNFTISAKQPRNSQQNGIITSTLGDGDSIWYSDEVGVHQIHLPSMREEATIPNFELEYNSMGEGAVLAATNNSIYFGGNKGFNRITKARSENNESSSTTLPPQLSEFSIFGIRKNKNQKKDFEDFDSFLLTENINHVTNKVLSHDESRFSISFELVNPIYPNQVFYRYRLNNHDNDWIYVGQDSSKTAQFNNVASPAIGRT